MNEVENLARIILRPDGSVHIAFRDVRSIRATTANMIKLFSDPFHFINEDSFFYPETTFETNKNRLSLNKVLGLTLATVTSDKQIICDFPELFQYIFSTEYSSENEEALNMNSIELSNVFSDEKSYLLRYYLEFTNHLTSSLVIKDNIRLRDQIQFEIIREILNTFFSESLPEAKNTLDLATQVSQIEDHEVVYQKTNAEDMIPLSDYAKLIGASRETIYKYIDLGLIKSAYKTSSGRYLINKNEKPKVWDRRKGPKKKIHIQNRAPRRRTNGSAADVKKSIEDRNLFTSEIAPYIHTYEELDYYEKGSYHEIDWNGRHALIIDVFPEYIGKDGKSNRELMMSGKAPRVPNSGDITDKVYHLHHIGQHSTSPLAIIPEMDHNSPNLSSIFHPGTPNKELHDSQFNVLKSLFWKTYIEEYEKAGSYRNIKYLNPKHKRKEKDRLNNAEE